MRLNSAARKFETSMPLQQKSFTIAASAKMFHILSDSLYKHKELAIVRELTANAYDAHTKAKTITTPFEVHLPTPLEPFFRIKDFGTGLSEQAIYDLYTKYGGSDKTMSDELVGGFGLGSKSPFAYTDQFSIESRHKGKLMKFHAFMDEHGMPSVAKITELPTTEANGLTVEVPVASQAYQAFADAAARVLPYVPIAFKVNILPDELAIVTAPPEYIGELSSAGNTTIKIRKTDNQNQGCHVVMGIVAYPIEASVFDYNSPEYLILTQFAADIYAPIGTFDIAASRESLSYNQQTKDLLTKCLADAAVPFCQEIKDKINDAPNLLEAYTRYKNLSHKVRNLLDRYADTHNLSKQHSIYALKEWFSKNATWQGKEFKMIVPTGIVWRRVEQSGWKRRKASTSTFADTSVATKTHGLDLYFLAGGGSRLPAMYWKEKHPSPFLPYFDQDPNAIMPAWVFSGDKAAIIQMFQDVGLDISTTLIDLPEIKRQAGGKRGAYGAHLYMTWKPPQGHGIERIKAADLEKYGNSLLIHPHAGERHYIETTLTALSNAGVIEAELSALAHVVIPPAHKRVKEALQEEGACASLEDFLKNGNCTIKSDRLIEILAQSPYTVFRSPWTFLESVPAKEYDSFLNILDTEELDTVWAFVMRDQWLHSLDSSQQISSQLRDQLQSFNLVSSAEIEREVELLTAIKECHTRHAEELFATYPMLQDLASSLGPSYYLQYAWTPVLRLLIHYLKT